MLGLLLTAGGARGAYQAGVLKRVGELSRLRDRPSPFKVVAGASAGAINGAMFASGADDITRVSQQITELWASLQVHNVFKTDIPSLVRGGAVLLKDLLLGGFLGGGHAQSLLDASPLEAHLNRVLPLDRISGHIGTGHLYALAVSATNYYSGKSFTFVQGKKGHPLWQKSRRVALSVPQMTVPHICASSAIPVVFQPVKVSTELGDYYFGDGGLRLVTPFSPAIRLGADRILAIGIRSQRAAEVRTQSELVEFKELRPRMKRPPLAQIFGTALNSIFLDHLDADLDHLKRMNLLLSHYGGSHAPAKPAAQGDSPTVELIREVKPLVISPSADIAEIAAAHAKRMPWVVRYFLEGLGYSKAQSFDLMSYLLFDSAYTRALIDLGYKDAGEHLDEIEAFLAG